MHDGLGSVVGEVDVNGALLCQKKTDVYGISRGNVGTALSRHGFVGGLGHYSDDETGLVYMRARYYDPAIGRFISQDSMRDGENWFVYCANDPTDRTDATGKESHFGNGAVFGVAAVCYAGAAAYCDLQGNYLACAAWLALAFVCIHVAAHEFVLALGGNSEQAKMASNLVPGLLFGASAGGAASKLYENYLKTIGRDSNYLSLTCGRVGGAMLGLVFGYSLACASEMALQNVECQ